MGKKILKRDTVSSPGLSDYWDSWPQGTGISLGVSCLGREKLGPWCQLEGKVVFCDWWQWCRTDWSWYVVDGQDHALTRTAYLCIPFGLCLNLHPMSRILKMDLWVNHVFVFIPFWPHWMNLLPLPFTIPCFFNWLMEGEWPSLVC